MTEAGEAGISKEQSPARREVRIFQPASAQTPDQVNEADYHSGVEGNSKQGMREAAVVGEAERRAAEAA